MNSTYRLLAMGNEKSNSYWEAELPPNYDRVGIENFIRAKYGIYYFSSFACIKEWSYDFLRLANYLKVLE